MNWGRTRARPDPGSRVVYDQPGAVRGTARPSRAVWRARARVSGPRRVRGADWHAVRHVSRGAGVAVGVPCNPPPWGALTAVDVGRGESSAGRFHSARLLRRRPCRRRATWGSVNLGGALVTAGGLNLRGCGQGPDAARLRRRDRQGAVERRAAGGRPGHADDVPDGVGVGSSSSSPPAVTARCGRRWATLWWPSALP